MGAAASIWTPRSPLKLAIIGIIPFILQACGSLGKGAPVESTHFGVGGTCAAGCLVGYHPEPQDYPMPEIPQVEYFAKTKSCIEDFWNKEKPKREARVLMNDAEGLRFIIEMKGKSPGLAISAPGFAEYHLFMVKIGRMFQWPRSPIATITPMTHVQTGWPEDDQGEVPKAQMRDFSEGQRDELERFYSQVGTELSTCAHKVAMVLGRR